MTPKEFDRQVEKLLSSFRFDRIHQHMVATGWTWHAGAQEHVPDINELRQTARVCFQSIRPSSDVTDDDVGVYASSTGGFRAERQGSRVALSFAVERKDTLDLVD